MRVTSPQSPHPRDILSSFVIDSVSRLGWALRFFSSPSHFPDWRFRRSAGG